MKSKYAETAKQTGVLRKYELIKLRGAKCEICGYDKNISALDFHHVDPSIKDSTLNARALQGLSKDKIQEEFSKCIVICANCHRELHNPQLSMDYVKELAASTNKKVFEKPEFKRKCPICRKPFKTRSGHFWKHELYCSEDCVNIAKTKDWPSYEDYVKAIQQAGSLRGAAKLLGEAPSSLRNHIKFYEKHMVHPENPIIPN